MRYPSYIRIFSVMHAGIWIDFTEICNPEVAGKEGDRRLREMRQNGWIDFAWRYRPGTHTPQYRITKVFDAWWRYWRKWDPPPLIKTDPSGQMEFKVA